jgi:transketolase
MALKNTTTPTALILSRQNIKDIPATELQDMKKPLPLKGGYLPNLLQPDITLIANGSELPHLGSLAIILEKEKI